jgi:hypothetical protein
MRLDSGAGPAAVSEKPAELPGEPAELSAATAGAPGSPADPVGPPAVLTVLTVLTEATAATQVSASTTSTATPAAVSRADRRRASVLAASPSRCHRITFAPLAAGHCREAGRRNGRPGLAGARSQIGHVRRHAEGHPLRGRSTRYPTGPAARLAGTARLARTALLTGTAGGRSAAV